MIATISMEGVHVEMHVVRLTFDYVKKNRRERAYIMEDLTSAQVIAIKRLTYLNKLKVSFPCGFILFINFLFFSSLQEFEELLRPALEANLAALKMKDLMHVSAIVRCEAWPLKNTSFIKSCVSVFFYSLI